MIREDDMSQRHEADTDQADRAEAPRGPMGPPAPASDTGTLSRISKKSRRAALYLRVSTDEQTVENQERELLEAAARAGWEVAHVYRDEGISGAKGRDKRPGLDNLLKDAARRKFDVVMAWSVDRLGRSLQDLVGILSDVHAYGIDLFLHQQAIDTTTPAGKAMFQMMGVFAEFERAMIRDRVRSGMARAKAKGQRFGRPAVPLEKQEAIRVMLRQGTGILKTAKLNGVGTFTVQRIKAEMAVGETQAGH